MVLSPFDEQTEAQFGGGGSSVLAQIREQERRAEFARIAADARRRAEAARRAKIEREAEVARQLAAFRAAQRRQQLERERRLAAEQAAKEAAEAARRAKEAAERERFRAIERQRELDRREADRRAAEARARTELEAPSRPTASPRPAAPQPSASARLLEDTPARSAGARAARESLRSERAVTDRNDALRRAFTVVPDGPRNLAKIDELVDASERIAGLDPAEELLFEAALAEDEAAAAAGPPSILSELAGKTPGEADALIRARAGQIERGLEAHDSFLDERRRRRRNAPLRDRLRRAPGGEALLNTLERATGEAKGPQTTEQRTLDREPETSLSRRNEARRRAFGVLDDGDRTLAAVELLAANGAGRPAPRFLTPEDEERLFEAELAVQEAASPHGAPSVLREVQEILAEEDVVEQERLIQETAAKIPGGTESVASFRAEQRQKEEDAARRREIAALPNGHALLDAEDAPERVFRGALEEDEIDPSGGHFRINFREGRGARPFELTPDEEALFASPSSEGFVSERAIEIYKQRRFNNSNVEHLNTLTPEARLRAELIAWFEESPRLQDQEVARSLRDGAPLPPGAASVPFVGGIVDATGALAGGVRGGVERFFESIGEAAFRDQQGRETVHGAVTDAMIASLDALLQSEVDALDAQIERDQATAELAATSLAWARDEGSDAWFRFSNEIAELDDLSSSEAIGRWHQAILGGLVEGGGFGFNPVAALEGLAGNETYDGSDHPLLRGLPDDLREPLGDVLELVTEPSNMVGITATAVGLATPPGWVAAGVAIVGLGAAWLIQDLENDDPASTRILEWLIDEVERLLVELDPDGEVRNSLPFRSPETNGRMR